MKLEIIGLVIIIIISIGLIKYSSFLGAVILIVGISIMMKAMKNRDIK